MPYKINKVKGKAGAHKKAKKHLAANKMKTKNESTSNNFDNTTNIILKTLIEGTQIRPNVYELYYTYGDNDQYRERSKIQNRTAFIEKLPNYRGVKIMDEYNRTLGMYNDVKTSSELLDVLNDVLSIQHVNGGLQPIADWWNNELIILNGKEVDINSLKVTNIDKHDYPDFSDAYISSGNSKNHSELDDNELEAINNYYPELVNDLANQQYHNVQEYIKSTATDISTDKSLDTAERVDKITSNNNPIHPDIVKSWFD